MIKTEISILINRKSDAELIKNSIINSNIDFPVYIFEYEEYLEVNITSDYEEWELDTEILKNLPDYEFTENPKKGRKEIRLQVARHQSELCTDGWGRPLENPLNETKYLIKKSANSLNRFNPQVTVLFENQIQDYYINIISGVNKNTDEKGFLLSNDFKTKVEKNEFQILKDRLYKSPIEAFHFGYLYMQEEVNQDFEEFKKNKKQEIRRQERLPRKVVRDFINSCNKNDITGIIQNLDPVFVFQKNIDWTTESEFQGIEEFKDYLNSVDQDLCNMNFIIRSSWNINLPINITIGVKYFPNAENKDKMTLKFRTYKFEIKNNTILRITEDRR